MEKAGARGVSGQGGSTPHPWGPSLQDTASAASELAFPPCGRHLLFFNLLQFHSHLPGPFQVPALFGQADAMARFLSSAPTTFSTIISASLDGTQAFNSTNRSSLFLPHFFFAQGQIVISSKSLSDDWVRWTHQARFQLSFGG